MFKFSHHFVLLILFFPFLNFNGNTPLTVQANELLTGENSFSERWGFGIKEGTKDVVPFFTDDNMIENTFTSDPGSVVNKDFVRSEITNNNDDYITELDGDHGLNPYPRIYVNAIEDVYFIFDFSYGVGDTIDLNNDSYFLIYQQQNRFNINKTSVANRFNNIDLTKFEIKQDFAKDEQIKLISSETSKSSSKLVAIKLTDLLSTNETDKVVYRFHLFFKYSASWFERDITRFAIVVDGNKSINNEVVNDHRPQIFGLNSNNFDSSVNNWINNTKDAWYKAGKSGVENINAFKNFKATPINSFLFGNTFTETRSDNSSGFYFAFLDILSGTDYSLKQEREVYYNCFYKPLGETIESPCTYGTAQNITIMKSDGETTQPSFTFQGITYQKSKYWMRIVNEGTYRFSLFEFSGKQYELIFNLSRSRINVNVTQITGQPILNQEVYGGIKISYSSSISSTIQITPSGGSLASYNQTAGEVSYIPFQTKFPGIFLIEVIDQANNQGYFNGNENNFSFTIEVQTPSYSLTFSSGLVNQTFHENGTDPIEIDLSSSSKGNKGAWYLSAQNNLNGNVPLSYSSLDDRGFNIGGASTNQVSNQVSLLTKSLIGAGQFANAKPEIQVIMVTISTENTEGNTFIESYLNNELFGQVQEVKSGTATEDRLLMFTSQSYGYGHLEFKITQNKIEPIYLRKIEIFSVQNDDLNSAIQFANLLEEKDTCTQYQEFLNDQSDNFKALSNQSKSYLSSIQLLDYPIEGISSGKYTLQVSAIQKYNAMRDLEFDGTLNNIFFRSTVSNKAPYNMNIFWNLFAIVCSYYFLVFIVVKKRGF